MTIDKTPGNFRPENDYIVSEEVTELLKTACYDCHSNTTN